MADPCYATLHEEWLLRFNQATSDQVATTRVSRTMALQAAAMDQPEIVTPLLQQVTFDMDREAKQLEINLKSLQVFAIEQEETDDGTADAFFAMYPECVCDPCDDDEEDEEEEPPILAIQPLNTVVHRPNNPPHDAQQRPSPQQRQPAAQPQPRNPYASSSNRPSSRGGPPPTNPYDKPNRPPPSSNTNSNNSWESVQNSNPFQSARNFQDAGGGEEQPDDNNNRQRYQQHPPPEPPPIQTKIPESLKRKFQPPKRGENGNKKHVGGSGGTASARPGSSRGTTDKDDDNDDLPEALKGLDKELIEKIQNEILESGDVITFDDIAGLGDAKQTVQELVCWPMKRPDLFTGLRRGPNGLLLYGPPGTGKTLIGKAVAHESGATFFSISSSSLTSKWIGEGEKLVRTLFAVAAYREPAVVFIDEIDSLLTQRKADENEASRRIKTEFLVQLDGTGTSGQGRVLVIGATNRPHELDDAARRRFVKRLYIPLPEAPDRECLLRTLLGKNRNKLTENCFKKLSESTDGFSGADLKALCVEAAMGPLRGLGARALEVDANDVPPISYKHFKQALRGMNPSVSKDDLNVYIEWDKTYGSRRAAHYAGEDDDDDSDAD